MNAETFRKIKYGEWQKFVSESTARRYHAKNIAALKEAQNYHDRKTRPLEVLILHGSGRSSARSCAQEYSNSQLFLRGAIEHLRNDKNINITEKALRDFNIEPCNGCYSASSTWCHMPCSCFVFDPMQELYPLVIKCDVMLVSTGVNQSAMSSRLKLFADRLISLDGGFYLSEKDFQMKTPEFKDRMVALERDLAEKNALVYDARMWGRVAAYFIASKDEENTMETIAKTEKSPLGYIEMTAWPLYDGFADYGFFHVKQNWYAGTTANWREPMSSDKAAHNADVRGMEKAKAVVNAAIELAQKFRRDSYPEFDGGARPRTRT